MKLICAPVATVTHAAFRTLVERFGGCDEYYSEMINAATFVNGGPFEKYYVIPDPAPEKTVWQITGRKAEHLAEAASMIGKLPGIGIDINMGCSAPDIVKSGAGAAWLSKDASETRAMVRSVKDALQASGKRLSVKLRLGDEHFTDERFFSLCDMLASEGVTLFALHPRTSKEKYRSPLRWEYVERLALRYAEEGVSVVLNGGVRGVPSMRDALRASPHASGIMIARGAIEKPWLFAELAADLRHESFDAVIDREKLALDFIDMLEKYQPQEFWKTRMQRFFTYYCLGFSFAHYFQTQMQNAKDTDDARARIRDYFQKQADDVLLYTGNTKRA